MAHSSTRSFWRLLRCVCTACVRYGTLGEASTESTAHCSTFGVPVFVPSACCLCVSLTGTDVLILASSAIRLGLIEKTVPTSLKISRYGV